MKIIINGLGVAGPALAYWLTKSGHQVVLVEQAPALRSGGYIIDFWGIGYDIVEKMGLTPEIRRLGYRVREVRFVDAQGRKRGGFNVDVFWRLTKDRFTSLRRSDLSATIYHAIEGQVETIFGDSVAGIEEHPTGVHVTFDHAPPEDADLVIGADGLHSRVRELAFGPDPKREVSLGYHVGAIEVEGYRPRDELVYVSYDQPGRQISRFTMRNDRTMLLFICRDQYVRGSDPKVVLKEAFGGAGREWPRIEQALDQTRDLYFDTVSQIRMQRWTKGRVALVGDAAACVSLMAGEGTGLAIAEAYALAGELHRSGGDHAAAFARYEGRMMSFVRKKQESAAKFASSFAPKTAFGIAFRNLVTMGMRVPFIADFIIGRSLRDEIELPDYDFAPR
jgi:2-polyprenyl-6-methoxyphenol hydroxylase-like FAD-dependent oxidoreductase